MIELTHKQVVVDGTPRIVMAGEVHYFRVAREEWGNGSTSSSRPA